MSEIDSPSTDTLASSPGSLKRKCWHPPRLSETTNSLSPQMSAIIGNFGSMEPNHEQSAKLQEHLVSYFCVAAEMLKHLSAAKEEIKSLQNVVGEKNKTIDLLKHDCDTYKNALKLKNAEIELLRRSVASYCSSHSTSEEGTSAVREVREDGGTLQECYNRCIQENNQLTLEVGTLKVKLESCLDHSRVNQKNLCDENQELKTKLYEMEGNLDQLSKTLEAKANDMQDMEALNQVLVAKELKINDVLQEARKKLISGLQDLLDEGSMIGIKRMGELNQKPFQEVCMQKFPCEDWSMKSMELCSKWQEMVKEPLWYPFKIIEKMGIYDEIIDGNDDVLKQLKNDWGDQVYNAVCVALTEVNEYSPSARSATPELWNLEEDRKAQMKEVIEYLLKLVKVPKKRITRRR